MNITILGRLLLLSLTLILTLNSCRNQQPKMTAGFQKDPVIEAKVDSVLKLMTIDEKIGQLVLYTSHYTTTGPSLPKNVEQAILNGTCGNVFNANVADYNLKLQKMAVEQTRLGIPLLFGYDVIHGMITIFPINLGMAATWDLDAIELSARVAAREAIAMGINWTYSPMVDISRDPRWGRVSEGSGEDPYLGCAIAKAMVRGYQGDDLSADSTILACVKHFAAYGAPQAGRDYHTVDMTERTLREVYLLPYRAAVEAGAGSIMTSFNDVDAIPATANKKLMTDILRGEWGFNGFVVTDYTAINELIPHGVAEDSLRAAKLALNAGVNMDMEGNIYHDYLKKLVESNAIESKQIDQMCREVLRVKFALGLFDDPYRYIDTTLARREILKPANRLAARDAARKSFVLLKNDEHTLPLSPGTKIALIGPFADSQADLLGSWSASGEVADVISIKTGLEARFTGSKVVYAQGSEPDGDDTSGFVSALAAARSADVVVMALGLPGRWSGEATSLTSIQIPDIQRRLLSAVRKLGKPTVVLLLNGRPLDLSEEIDMCDAMLEIWYPGTEGGNSVADVLSGDFNPSGKLTMTFPRNVGQIPIHYDMKNTGRPFTPGIGEQHYVSRYLFTPNTPLFPFGFGLSYTTYAYSDIKTDKRTVKPSESINVSAKVRNTGTVDGTETVQLYIRDLVASVTRPVRQLKGFEKVNLKAGEEKTVSFTLTPEHLSFYRQDMSWGSEPGMFTVWIGGSSQAELSTDFEIVK